MLADHAAGVLAVGTRLGAETGGVGDPLARHVIRLDDLVADQVGHRHLGGGDQVVARFAAELEQILLELGQLPGAAQAVGVDHVGHIGLGVAVLAGVGVEHELDQGPVHARQGPGHDGEARAGQPRRRLEVEQADGVA